MGTSEIERAAAGYLALCSGDCAAALRAAVADLLDVHEEAEFRKLALDQWVSHGYVQGRASERLAATRQCSGGPGGESACAGPLSDGEIKPRLMASGDNAPRSTAALGGSPPTERP